MNTSFVDASAGMDFKIIGQLVSSIGLLHVFPSETEIGNFLEVLITDVPGCQSVSFCFRKLALPMGGGRGEPCRHCARGLDQRAESGPYSCGLVEPGKVRAYPMETAVGFYGYFILTVSSEREYVKYEPFIRNLGNALAMILENRSQQAALRVSEERFRIASETTNDLVYEWDLKQGLEWFGNIDEMLGYGPGEFPRTMDGWVTSMHPEDMERTMAAIQAHLEDSAPYAMEYRIRRKDGVCRWWSARGAAARTPEGTPSKWIGSITDITERKQAEAEKEKEAQNRQLQKAESLGRMAGAIAQNFNNQLAAVLLNLELLQQEMPPNSGSGLDLSAALQSTHKAANISAQMLVYLGQTHVQREPLDLSDVCRQNLPLLQAAFPKAVVLKTDLPASGPCIRANASQMQQVLTNLLTNASEASNHPQDTIRLAVTLARAVEIPAVHRFPIGWQPQYPAYACIEVADSGCGIMAGDIERIFDPFFTSKFTGRGLGLSAVLGIVREHGGGITVESEPGRGSVFRVFLPVTDVPVLPKPVPVVPAPKMAGRGAVLVVEDELSLRATVTRALQRIGFTVFAAADGVEAVELFRQHRDEIRCVLCDLTMPRLGGWETLTALRKFAPGLPVILSSGYDHAKVMEGHHAELPQAFLHKPYELKALINLINQVQPELRAQKEE